MKRVICLIVDDEPLAQEVLKQYISKVDRLELLGCCSNANDALALLAVHKEVELLFLDIQMPSISGIELLQSLKNSPHVIFTTANRSHALDGFDLNAVDYLLKPCSFPRFLQGVNKVFALVEASVPQHLGHQEAHENYLVFKEDGKWVKVEMDELLFVEAYGEYVKLYTDRKVHLSLASLKSIEEKLPTVKFIRTHRSYLVAFKHISSMEGNILHISQYQVPISRTLRDEFLKRFAGNG